MNEPKYDPEKHRDGGVFILTPTVPVPDVLPIAVEKPVSEPPKKKEK